MISLKEFRNNFEDLKQKLKPKGIQEKDLLIIKNLDTECLLFLQKINAASCERNILIKDDAQKNKEALKALKQTINDLKAQEAIKLKELNHLLYLLPNYAHPSTNEEETTIYEWGVKKTYDFPLLSHIELGEKKELFLFEESVSICSTGHIVYCNKGEKLFRALIEYTLEKNEEKGYKRFWMPVIVSRDSLFCTSQISKFSEMLFQVNDHKFLSPTGEVQLVNLFRNKIIEEDKLPIKLTTNTNCFRSESVGSGVESNGILRMYQFNKTEIVTLCKPESSEEVLENMSLDAESILKELNIPYRKVLLANNDIGFAACKTYDLEAWFPFDQKYREISSISNTLSFQARRGKIRYKKDLLNKAENTKYVHILNGSSLAIDRLLATIIENYQDKTGKIIVPQALRKYLSFTDM